VCVPRASCEACGEKLPAKSKFCPSCGAQVGATSGETAVEEIPPAEPAPAPVEPQVAQRKYFGVPPSTLLLVIAIGLVAGAIALFVASQWPLGLVLLGLSAFVFAGFLSQSRRLPGETSGMGRASAEAVRSVRARAGWAKETVAAHGNARIELMKLRRERASLGSRRDERLRELGDAVYRGDRTATKDRKEAIKQLDDDIRSKEEAMAKVVIDAQERMGRANLEVQPTRIVGESEPPMPAPVPEPGPPPDEGQPPEPAVVPEPYPPPDEGDRPRPPEIPEPGPNPGPE
jgi:hypothetical protein